MTLAAAIIIGCTKGGGGGLCGRGLNWMVEIERFRLVWLYFSYLTPSRRITYNESLP